jgi:3-hydroxybutyryl-CoA dehydratase
MQGKTCKEIHIGDTARFTKTVSESDVYGFAGITGDMNPVHIDKEYAKKSIFGKQIAHGILSAGFISTVIGTQLPGPGAIYVKQVCEFKKPVYIGDTISAIVEVTKKDEEKNKVWLRTYCTNQDGKIVVEGEATILPTKEG